MRTADPHLIYNIVDNQRINHSRSIYIGDHVWIGQNAMILKGSSIHSGSVIGAMSLVAGKTIHSNSCWGGNPVRMLKENIAGPEKAFITGQKRQRVPGTCAIPNQCSLTMTTMH